MEKINTRVVKIIDDLNSSKSSFAKQLGVSPVIISHISSGRNKVGLDLIQRLLTEFPQYSAKWLLNGEGAMKEDENVLRKEFLESEIDHIYGDLQDLEAKLEITKRRLGDLKNGL